ncbi:hypothetical protein AB0N09_41520 [Streptomyces erythrochromogenes]|uniref:trypsin-like serine peptidase n=1 Tax=Streptomyces erythrochromogenes TaxID=285574 RepID=UPI003449E500
MATRIAEKWSRSGFGSKAVSVVIAAACVLPIGAGTALAAEVPAAGDTVVHPDARTPADQKRIEDYWTTEKMASVTQPGVPEPVKDNADRLPDQDRTKPTDGAVWGNGPIKSVGRLFATTLLVDPWGGKQLQDRSCTATVVSDPENPSKRTVVTASHCVVGHPYFKDGQPGYPDWSRPEWDTNLYFVPGYRDGAKPQGGFTVNTTLASRAYVEGGDSGADVAMLAMNPSTGGQQIAQVTGAQKVAFETARHEGQFTYDFGYTSEGGEDRQPWKTGQLLGFCAGPATKSTSPQTDPAQWGMACTMGKGSSGGPHFVDFDPATSTGTVVGVNCQAGQGANGERIQAAAAFTSTTRQLYELAQQQDQ